MAMQTQWLHGVDGSLQGLNYAMLQRGSVIYMAADVRDDEISDVFSGLQTMELAVLNYQHENRKST